jgi:hypothetical protein
MSKSKFAPAPFTIGEKAPKESPRVHWVVISSDEEQRDTAFRLGFTVEKRKRNRQ